MLQGVDDGKLKIEVKNVKVDIGSQQGYFWVQENAKQQLQGILNDVQSHIGKKENEISDTMNHLKGEIEQLFGKSWKFVLRGDDDFLINKAAFNRRVSLMTIIGCVLISSMFYSEGDLLAQLNYRLED